MGKHAEGWKLLVRSGVFYVRFRHAKKRHCISTGKSDRGEASTEAARIYGHVVRGGKQARSRVRLSLETPEVLLGRWLVSISGVLDPETVKTYEGYAGKHWATFKTLDDFLDDAQLAEYARERLRNVLRKTLSKELSALYGFLGWCKEQGAIAELPARPEVGRKVTGKRSGKQRAQANEMSPEQVEAFIAALPEWSERTRQGKAFAVRSRFRFAYETGLRPATLDALTWGHWNGESLRIDDEHDKARFGREVPLSAAAIAALESLAAGGPSLSSTIFGRHDYRVAIRKACLKASIPLTIAPYDFRHARGTHLVDAGVPRTAVAYMLGQKRLTTTDIYTRPTQRAAEAAIAALDRAGSIRDQKDTDNRAKEGGRIPTPFRALEPERPGYRQSAGFLEVDGRQDGPGDARLADASGSVIPFHSAAFSLGFDVADAYALALEGAAE
jgi:integrase